MRERERAHLQSECFHPKHMTLYEAHIILTFWHLCALANIKADTNYRVFSCNRPAVRVPFACVQKFATADSISIHHYFCFFYSFLYAIVPLSHFVFMCVYLLCWVFTKLLNLISVFCKSTLFFVCYCLCTDPIFSLTANQINSLIVTNSDWWCKTFDRLNKWIR